MEARFFRNFEQPGPGGQIRSLLCQIFQKIEKDGLQCRDISIRGRGSKTKIVYHTNFTMSIVHYIGQVGN